MEWVNRVGIVLEFLSFWFAAPEILGEGRLRALERRVEKQVRQLPIMTGALMMVALIGLGAGRGIGGDSIEWVGDNGYGNTDVVAGG
jgi:hypothetical protein